MVAGHAGCGRMWSLRVVRRGVRQHARFNGRERVTSIGLYIPAQGHKPATMCSTYPKSLTADLLVIVQA